MDGTVKPTKHTRRAALRTWLTGSASLTLLAIAGALPLKSILASPAEQTAGPAPAQVPAVAPSASGSSAPSTSSVPGASAPSAAAGSAAQMCVLTREQTEGPYYIDVDLLRSDITEGKEGLPLALNLTVLNAATCQPLPDATVEVWHCDAAGDYSGFSGSLPNMQGEPPGSDSGNPPPMRPGGPPPGGPGDPPPGGPPPGGMMPGSGPAMRNTPTNDLVFLRGGQVSDAAGRVTFRTIYPGWYRGRTVHIHLKAHVGGQEVHTSQMFFDDATSDEVFGSQPYAAHAGRDGWHLPGGRPARAVGDVEGGQRLYRHADARGSGLTRATRASRHSLFGARQTLARFPNGSGRGAPCTASWHRMSTTCEALGGGCCGS